MPAALPARRRERGAMLLVALGILALLVVLAVAFVTIMDYEKTAAVNYADSQRAKLTAEAGMTRVLASLRDNLGKPLFVGGDLAPHIFGRRTAEGRGKEIDPTIPVETVKAGQHPFFWGYTGREYTNNKAINFGAPETIVGLDEYKVKVLETSALIDLNHPTELADTGQPVEGQVFQLVLESLGQALALSTQHRFDPIPVAVFDGPGGRIVGAKAIIAYRSTLDGDRFTSKSQLRYVFPNSEQGDRAYDLLKDFVTAHAWRDYKAVKPPASGGEVAHHAVDVEPNGRAQLNLNLAPREVLIAAIAPIAGRRYAYLPETTTQLIEQGNEASYFGMNASGSNARPADYKLQEETAYQVREGYVYVGPIGVQKAGAVADWIISQRPFLSMAHFHARLLEEMDKQAGGLDGGLPQAIDQVGGAKVMPSADARYNLNGIHALPWFPQWVRRAGYSLIAANFNPCFASNTLNPSQAAWLPIDKGSLIYPQDWSAPDPRSTLRSRQTSDGCVDARGIYELTSLGQILGQEGQIIAKEKVFTVIRTFDMTVHRTQVDFETDDLKYAPGNGGPERFAIASYPENRTFFKANNQAQMTDVPDPMVARNWGHLELEPRVQYDFGEILPVTDIAAAQWGTPLFAALFDGQLKGLNPGAYLHAQVGNQVALGSAQTPTAYQKARGDAIRRATTTSNWRATAGNGTLFRDGFYSSHRKSRDLNLWYRNGAGIDDDLAQGALGLGSGAPAAGDSQQGNSWYRRGGVEFWYRPDFDWSYQQGAGRVPFPMVCGYVFASRVYFNPGDPTVDAANGKMKPAPLADSPTDGTQLYVFRNSLGQLRATRLYFRIVGDPDTGEKPDRFIDQIDGDPYPAGGGTHFQTGGTFVNGGGTGGAINLYKEAAERRPWTPGATPGSPGTGYIWPPAELRPDPGILRARVDAYVDFSRLQQWRSNEWHHIAVAWDDGQGDVNRALRIYVDGVLASTSHGLPSSPSPPNNNLFVRVNEPPTLSVDGASQRFPKDHIYVAGIERNLAKGQKGVFKHTNTVAQAASETVLPKQIRLYANGTMDDFCTWDLGTPADRDRLQRVLQFGRYERVGEYVQAFDLDSRFPGGSAPLQLARLSVQTLLPTRHGDHAPSTRGQGAVVVSIDEPIGVQLRHPRTGGVVSSFAVDAMNDYQHVDLVGADGLPALLTPPADPLAVRPKLRYTLSLRAANFPQGPGGQTPAISAIETPVVQEIGLSWFLPNEEVLLRERVID